MTARRRVEGRREIINVPTGPWCPYIPHVVAHNPDLTLRNKIAKQTLTRWNFSRRVIVGG